jgi:hypothetical protein
MEKDGLALNALARLLFAVMTEKHGRETGR